MDEHFPHFVIVGAMKAGTTTLFDWLGQHDAVRLSGNKEPEVLLRGRNALECSQLYRDVLPGGEGVKGEASAKYADPEWIARVANALRELNPSCKVIYILRDPEERLRSHFRHEVLRGRVEGDLAREVLKPGNKFVDRSLYSKCLDVLFETSTRKNLFVVQFDELFGPSESAWSEVLDFIGLDYMPRPHTLRNSSSDKPKFRPLMSWIFDLGLHRHFDRLPGRVREIGRVMLLDSSDETQRQIERSASEPLPGPVRAALQADWELTKRMLGDWNDQGRLSY